jgi:heterodisulfide reductase subunit B
MSTIIMRSKIKKTVKFIRNKKVRQLFRFGGWNFVGDIKMNHIIDFLLIQLDMKEKVKIPNTLIKKDKVKLNK